MSDSPDRLYDLLPVVYRSRDAEEGFPLRALLRVIAEQVDVVEEDIALLYENWFIETCQDWVVPYIGDLIGYQPIHEAGEPDLATTVAARTRNKILIPRREVAKTVAARRRKGTLALLELLANDVAGWPARAVEFYRLLGWTQHLNHLRLAHGRTVDLRDGNALDRLDGPFDELAHTVELRRVASHRERGRYNLPSVGVFVWRLKTYSVTRTPAACLDQSPHCYTFSVVGHNTPLYNRPQPENQPTHIAEEENLPAPIRRRPFEERISVAGKPDRRQASARYYGSDKSLAIWAPGWPREDAPQPIPREVIIPTDLSRWHYRPPRNFVAVDPERGRIAFPPKQAPDQVVLVSYRYAFSADIGGGEYTRPLSQPTQYVLYRVGELEAHTRINEALTQWDKDQQTAPAEERLRHAIVEITDSGLYEETFSINLKANHSLQIRAANRKRPVVGLSNLRRGLLDAFKVTGARGSRLTLDGLLVVGRAVRVSAQEQESKSDDSGTKSVPYDEQIDDQGARPPAGTSTGDLAEIVIRHCTLVPGWELECNCEPRQPTKPSLELNNTRARVTVEHSIIGSIQVVQDEVARDPLIIRLSDSILDATDPELEALDSPGCPVAHASVTVKRSTVIGQIQTHAIELAENCIFNGLVKVARRQQGCVRFCYVTPGSRTPRRFECQPDLVQRAAEDERCSSYPNASQFEIDAVVESERLRVEPEFNSLRYGAPTYCQLTTTCAEEITRGADDESEMGVFHDLYQPQRAANLQARLDEFTPAGMEAGIIDATTTPIRRRKDS